MESRPTTQPRLPLWVLAHLATLAHLAAADATYKFVTEPTPTNFQGFYPDGPKTERIDCASTESFSTWSQWAACCKTNEACGFISRCSAGIVTEPNGKTGICPTSLANCYTMTIFASYPYASQSWLQMGCARDFSASKVYREIVPTAPTTSSPSTRPATTGAAATTPPSPTNTPAPPPAAASQAWIAGAVIGVVVAVAALGFLAFWFGRRRGRKTGVAVGPSASTLAIIPPGKSYAPSSSEPDRGSYAQVPAAAASGSYPLQKGYYGGHTSPPPGQYPGGYGGSPGYHQQGGAYDQGGQGYDGSGGYGGRSSGFYQVPPAGVEEMPVRTPVGKFEPWKRSELDSGR
ncbi:hypothetical protein B0T18DRAFT_492566 [Schizothecium vesticola]|uniref:Mid2 domain-containing protein n=1 Tax=Schizothecium vesticola TaxID=314040 RepID=A0AA40BQQ2_9PEZI|nr:hypothetical protein B0T18DRAFT_492566 [Schizothecium vesticola]